MTIWQLGVCLYIYEVDSAYTTEIGSSISLYSEPTKKTIEQMVFFVGSLCYGENKLTVVIAATDEVLVPERGVEPKEAITNWASRQRPLVPLRATPVA